MAYRSAVKEFDTISISVAAGSCGASLQFPQGVLPPTLTHQGFSRVVCVFLVAHVQDGEYSRAVTHYTAALNEVSKGSEEESVLRSNRSAAYAKMGNGK